MLKKTHKYNSRFSKSINEDEGTFIYSSRLGYRSTTELYMAAIYGKAVTGHRSMGVGGPIQNPKVFNKFNIIFRIIILKKVSQSDNCKYLEN